GVGSDAIDQRGEEDLIPVDEQVRPQPQHTAVADEVLAFQFVGHHTWQSGGKADLGNLPPLAVGLASFKDGRLYGDAGLRGSPDRFRIGIVGPASEAKKELVLGPELLEAIGEVQFD